MRNGLAPLGLPLAVVSLLLAPLASAVTVDWVSVGGAGNAADTTGLGAVAAIYRISRTEVTNAQYAEFLNAVAATDTNALYDTGMSSGFGGITRSGSSGSFTYSAIVGRESLPVNFVSFYDALRFANWLQNGQPTGLQGNGTTEDGAYTLLGGTPTPSNGLTVMRNAAATVFLTSEDEWYKAAYYDVSSMSYFVYPAGSDTQTTCASPGMAINTANCDSVVLDLTSVGTYTGSASPNGTFDQGGNVREWNETIVFGSARAVRGGGFDDLATALAATSGLTFGIPASGDLGIGFRVASVPPVSVPMMPGLGLLVMTVLLGLVYWRRSCA